jgi:2-polyprenyl-3-methyl-5-hydroxy-6-metoxy-1,4-benzoquinol methylase
MNAHTIATSFVHDHTTVVSPLTGNDNVELLDEITVADLRAVYLDLFDVDVHNELLGIDTMEFYRCRNSGLRFFHPAITGSESFYEALQRQPWYYLGEKPEYDFASGFISTNDAVLEVGCGPGEFAKKLAAKSYLGLELSSKAQEMAAVNGIQVVTEPVETHCRDYEQHYDVVCAFQVLEHIADPAEFIQSCLHCLRPGGLLIYSVPNADSFLAYSTNSVLNMPPHHVSWWTEFTFRYVASRYGMEVLQLHRERLADIHVRQYAAMLTRETLLYCLGKTKQSLINRSLLFRTVNKLSSPLSYPLAKMLEDVRLRPIGHSITAVFRKPFAS